MSCANKVTWGIIPSGEKAIPACNAHVGEVMEAVYKRRGAEFAFAYVGDKDHDVRCAAAVGAGVTMEMTHEVLVTEPIVVDGRGNIGVEASARVL